MAESVPLQAEDLVRLKLPDILQAPNTTVSQSTQNFEFTGTLGYWSNFEREVRKSTLSQKWTPHILTHQPGGVLPSPFYLTKEHYLCGDEYSIQGRFGQNVGQVMSAVFGSLGMDAGFADFKGCGAAMGKNEKVPDYSVITQNGLLLTAGEVKTPWAHALDDDLGSEFDLRRTLGQIARYMTFLQLKYAFLTTYRRTIFLKLGKVEGKEKLVLWHSNPIRNDVGYVEVPSQQGPVPTAYHNKVTIRECFMFLGTQIAPSSNDRGRHKPQMGCVVSDYVREWRKSRAAGVSKKKFEYISDVEGVTPPAHRAIPPVPALPSSAGESRSSGNDPQHRQQSDRSASRTRELAVRTNERGSHSRSRSRSPSPMRDSDGLALVVFDRNSRSYYFKSDDGRYIGIGGVLDNDRRGNPYFKINGQKYMAKLVQRI